MQDLEAKRLRESLVEYENYLNEIRQVTRKNVEALDVIQKYTDQSAAGMQNLAEQSIEGIQRVTTESAGGLRKIIETGTSNLSRMAEGSQDSINRTAQECMVRLQNYTKEGLQKNQETAEQVSQIEQAILEHMDEIKQLLKQSDDFTHKENVKVYRNVQAVVVDEVKKQTEAIAAQNDELVRRNEHLQKQGRGLRPLMIITLVTALANIVLAAAQIAGLF